MIGSRFALVVALMLGACSAGSDSANEMDGNGVSLRNLTETEVARELGDRELRVQGTRIPTPSDTRSDYYLLRERRTIGGTIIAILREHRGERVAYARTEVDCARRLFHVVGVGPTRAAVETAVAHDGPLRPIAGLPLREDLARFICARSNTPLPPA